MVVSQNTERNIPELPNTVYSCSRHGVVAEGSLCTVGLQS